MRNPLKNEKGQASLMIGIMMLTFIVFFAFVVNTGMLVNAKINLQNAADLAAYSGASVQARLLNQISFLNYEMRRQYKKFLFRYYVIGNMSMDCFPSGGLTCPGPGPGMKWKPKNDDPTDYGMPVVCLTPAAGNDNFCHMPALQKITVPPSTILDQVNNTLRGQLNALESIRQRNCLSISMTNKIFLNLWLFNTDPEFEDISRLSPEQQKQLNTLKFLGFGLGLIPREVILRKRIDTLQSYVNAKPEKGVSRDTIDGMMNDQESPAKERTIQAFLSAFNTLGENNFADSDITMDELLPPGNDGSQLLGLTTVGTPFSTIYIQYAPKGKATSDIIPDGPPPGVEDKPTDCTGQKVEIAIPAKVPLGVKKDPSILTYYAIRLRAKAPVMFSPFGNMTLTAYSAARPFGSRIGPQGIDDKDFFRNINNMKIPFLPVKADDSPAPGKGWDNPDFLNAVYLQFADPTSRGVIQVNNTAARRAYQAAMVPNPWEVGKYNMMTDVGASDPFVKYFDASYRTAIWAPIFPLSKIANVKDDLTKEVQKLLPTGPIGSATGGGDPNAAKFQQQIIDGLARYFQKLMDGKGEDDEGFKIARLRDPFFYEPDGTGAAPNRIAFGGSGGNSFIIQSIKSVKSSWNAINDQSLRDISLGRLGYSVKLVSYPSLSGRVKEPSTSMGGAWTNTIQGDAELDQDLNNLEH